MKPSRARRLLDLLRFMFLFPPAFCMGFWLMLPALLEQRVPVYYWPAAVLYALFIGRLR